MMIKFWDHWSNAIQVRTTLWKEINRVRKSGKNVPSDIRKLIWNTPQNQEEFIWLLRFIDPSEDITLVDIGGNSGYWAEDFLHYFPKAKINAFEPVPEMFKQYKKRFEKNAHVAAYNVALGDEMERREINVAKDYGLTSFHTYSEELKDMNTQFKERIDVAIDLLDNYNSQIDISMDSKLIMKVDVQGFESKVLKGGKKVFGRADMIILECSFVNEFANELPTFGELVSELRPLDLHPIDFGLFDRKASSSAFERNVLFVKSKYFERIWNK